MVWVVGCKGMLGTELCRRLAGTEFGFEGTGREVDFTDFDVLENFVRGKKIDFIVNCGAYTAVDKAETEPESTNLLNCIGPSNLAKIAKKIGAKLIHVSTDYVFDGTGNVPYTEDTPVAPIGVYGKTKADGENQIIQQMQEFYILRTAWLYGWAGKNFVYTMIRAMNSRDSLKVVNDQKGSPTFCGDLADVIIEIIRRNKKNKPVPYGVYHVTDLGEISWYDFAVEINRQGIERGLVKNHNCVINPCTTEEYPTPAKRPSYSVLDKTKIQDALELKLPEWKDSLNVFLKSELFDKNKITN